MSIPPCRSFSCAASRPLGRAAAATALGYTQSGVSRQIASLERVTGAPLLERRHDGVRLTPAGLVPRALAALRETQLAITVLSREGSTSALVLQKLTSPTCGVTAGCGIQGRCRRRSPRSPAPYARSHRMSGRESRITHG